MIDSTGADLPEGTLIRDQGDEYWMVGDSGECYGSNGNQCDSVKDVEYLYGIESIVYHRSSSASSEPGEAEEGAATGNYEYMLAVKDSPPDLFGRTFSTPEQAQEACDRLPARLHKETVILRRLVGEWHEYAN